MATDGVVPVWCIWKYGVSSVSYQRTEPGLSGIRTGVCVCARAVCKRIQVRSPVCFYICVTSTGVYGYVVTGEIKMASRREDATCVTDGLASSSALHLTRGRLRHGGATLPWSKKVIMLAGITEVLPSAGQQLPGKHDYYRDILPCH